MTTNEKYQEGKDYSQKVTETGREFKINWTGVIKWTVVAGMIGGAYYFGKKQGMKQEAMKHVTSVEPVTVNTVEIPEI